MTNTGERDTSLFNETTERNDGKRRCASIHAFGYLPDLSFLCDFDFFLCQELRLFDSAVLSWLALAAQVTRLSVP